MKKISLAACCLLLVLSVVSRSHAQQGMELQVTGSSGTVLSNSSGATLHFTVGEMIVSEAQNNNILAQGFHQIMVWHITPVDETEEAPFRFRIYPNPASDVLHIETEQPLEAMLLDVQGRVSIAPTLIHDFGEFDLTRLPSGTYFLQSTAVEGKRMPSFKIQIVR